MILSSLIQNISMIKVLFRFSSFSAILQITSAKTRTLSRKKGTIFLAA